VGIKYVRVGCERDRDYELSWREMRGGVWGGSFVMADVVYWDIMTAKAWIWLWVLMKTTRTSVEGKHKGDDGPAGADETRETLTTARTERAGGEKREWTNCRRGKSGARPVPILYTRLSKPKNNP
jgi:hypothetical protein